MEKTCEFCASLRPVVYCKADAAHLCLSCDSRVHSANALSHRHPRTLICESCRNRPAYVRCSDHQMFMCRGCDRSHHDLASQHQKQLLTSYTGCPAAKELVKLWGFNQSDIELSTPMDKNVRGNNMNIVGQFNSQTGHSSVVSAVSSLQSNSSEESEVRSGSSLTKPHKHDQQGKKSQVLQQILDLERLQLSERIHSSSLHDQEEVDASSTIDDTAWKMNENADQHLEHYDFQPEGSHNEEMTEKPFPSFSQMNHLPDVESPLSGGDSLWQSKSPEQSNQIWSQNMQDIGVCDELRCMDDLNMPDFDLTFQNYEELFKGEQEPTRAVIDVDDVKCFSLAHNPSSENANLQEQSCNSADTESEQPGSGETTFIGHKEKKVQRNEKQVGFANCRRVKSDAKKRVKSKARKAEFTRNL